MITADIIARACNTYSDVRLVERVLVPLFDCQLGDLRMLLDGLQDAVVRERGDSQRQVLSALQHLAQVVAYIRNDTSK